MCVGGNKILCNIPHMVPLMPPQGECPSGLGMLKEHYLGMHVGATSRCM